MNLSDLLAAYRKAQAKRAVGGLYSLSGFDIQIREYLIAFVEHLVRRPGDTRLSDDLEQAGEVFSEHILGLWGALEALSDFTTDDTEGNLICVQVKRTVQPKVARDAALEFVVIDEFFEAQSPLLRDSVKYELRTQTLAESVDWANISLTASQLPADHRGKLADYQIRFNRLRERGQLLPPTARADPQWRLLCLVYPHVSDPVGFVAKAVDACLKRGVGDEGAVHVRERIVELFRQGERLSPELPGRLLTPKDFDLVPDADGTVITGDIPEILDLQNNRFMRRPRLLAEAEKFIDDLMDERERRADHFLDVAWLSGPSGSGKSVLLLQLMEHLVRRGEQVIWLEGSERHSLIKIIEAHKARIDDARRLGTEIELPPVIFVDDIYDPQTRDDLDIHRMGQLVHARRSHAWPLIVTCGPPEFHLALERDSKRTGIRLHDVKVALVDRAEAADLLTWFEQHTGYAPQATRGPAFDRDEGLMLSLMIEMRYGDLRAFASRFCDRLIASQLDGHLRRPLALNRLYIWAPRQWLDISARESLQRFNRSDDLHIDHTAPEGYLRLTHPHLANAIYLELRDTSIGRANDLGDAFEWSALGDPNQTFAPNGNTCRRILRALADHVERLSDLDERELNHRIVVAWARLSDAGIGDEPPPGWTSLNFAEAWAMIIAWSRRAPEVERSLARFDPRRRAFAALDHQFGRWPGYWLELHRLFPNHAALLQPAFRWLSRNLSYDDQSQWSRIWESLADCPDHTPDTFAELRHLGSRWLELHAERPDWNYLLRKFISLPGISSSEAVGDWMAILAVRLQNFPTDPQWPYLWQILIEHFKATANAIGLRGAAKDGWTWHFGKEQLPEWTYVWQRLVELRAELDPALGSKLLNSGLSWLDSREDRPEWAHVWQRLVELRTELDPALGSKLLNSGLSWLDSREDRPEWSHVWERLVELRTELDPALGSKLLNSGLSWLDSREDRPEWAHVWRRLVELRAELDPALGSKLLNSGLSWLVGRQRRAEWPFVWQKLLACDVDLPADSRSLLHNAGINWLLCSDKSAGWPHVLMAASEKILLAPLLKVGEAWIDRNPAHEHGADICALLLHDSTELGHSLANSLRAALMRRCQMGKPISDVLFERLKRLRHSVVTTPERDQRGLETLLEDVLTAWTRLNEGEIVDIVIVRRAGSGFIAKIVDSCVFAYVPDREIQLLDRERPVGRQLRGRIIILNTHMREVTISPRQARFAELRCDQILTGRVVNVVPHIGAFINVDGIVGLAHRSNVSTMPRVGDYVSARVGRIDTHAQKVSFDRIWIIEASFQFPT